MKTKILGTVQLGMPYGINNGVMPSEDYSVDLLKTAYDQGVRFLDSARAYGKSLEVIGNYHSKYPDSKFKVYSKFMASDISIDFDSMVKFQLEILHLEKLEGLYFHRFDEYSENPELLKKIKGNDKILSAGVSLYQSSELKKVLQDPDVDLVQIPYSIFHHHSKMREALISKSSHKKIFSRSIYLQGLLFLPYEKLTGVLSPFVEVRKFIDQLSVKLNMTKDQLAVSYVLEQDKIDGILFGAETHEQVRANVVSPAHTSLNWNELLKDMPVVSDEILHPGNWQ